MKKTLAEVAAAHPELVSAWCRAVSDMSDRFDELDRMRCARPAEDHRDLQAGCDAARKRCDELSSVVATLRGEVTS